MAFKLSFNLDPRIGDPYEFVKEARSQGVPIDYLTVENAIAYTGVPISIVHGQRNEDEPLESSIEQIVIENVYWDPEHGYVLNVSGASSASSDEEFASTQNGSGSGGDSKFNPNNIFVTGSGADPVFVLPGLSDKPSIIAPYKTLPMNPFKARAARAPARVDREAKQPRPRGPKAPVGSAAPLAKRHHYSIAPFIIAEGKQSDSGSAKRHHYSIEAVAREAMVPARLAAEEANNLRGDPRYQIYIDALSAMARWGPVFREYYDSHKFIELRKVNINKELQKIESLLTEETMVTNDQVKVAKDLLKRIKRVI